MGSHTAWAKQDFESDSVVNLYPAAGTHRQLIIRPRDHAAPEGPAMEFAVWQWGEVMSGVATLSAPVVEAFVPQMLNYESVGGVSFKKGCYPGQEVVARSQFRGTLKRRASIIHCDAALAAGQEIVVDGDTEQVAGQVVQAARSPNGGYVAIASLQLSMLDEALGVDGAAVHVLPLPYPILDDI
nr:hypothetical protein [uncultured Rhodoferax sp.]